MKIFVIANISPFVTGGAEMQARRLIDEWVSNGHEVHCVGQHLSNGSLELSKGRIKLSQIKLVKNKGRILKAISYFISLSIILITNRHWPDIIYTRFLGDGAISVCVLKFLKIINLPIMSTPANAGEQGDVSYIHKAPFRKIWIKLINSQCNSINIIAPRMLDDLQRANILRPSVSQIPNGIQIQDSNNHHANSAQDTFKILTIGRLSIQKGFDILINALSLCKMDGASFELHIVGDGPERQKIQDLVALHGLSSCVFLEGEKNQSEIRFFLNTCNIFILPSRYEGMANAGLEAMEAGCPVILTACGGLDTYINKDMGWIAKCNSVESLKSAIDFALNTNRSKLHEMGKTNREFIIKNFDIRIVAKKYLYEFQRIMEK